jgi:hypothetical protein
MASQTTNTIHTVNHEMATKDEIQKDGKTGKNQEICELSKTTIGIETKDKIIEPKIQTRKTTKRSRTDDKTSGIAYGGKVFQISDFDDVHVDVLSNTDYDYTFLKKYYPYFQTIYDSKKLKILEQKINELEKITDTYEKNPQIYTTIDQYIIDVLVNRFWLEENKKSFMTETCDRDKIYVNSMINFSYLPFSQKHLSHYEKETFIGLLFDIDHKNENCMAFTIKTTHLENGKEHNELTIRSYFRGGCDYHYDNGSYVRNIFKFK